MLSVQSREISLSAIVAARLSSELPRADVTIGVTWGRSWGCMANQSENPPIQSSTVENTRIFLLNGMIGSLARNMDRSGLASSSSESARDSATAYQACKHASRAGQAAGVVRQAEIEESRCWSNECNKPSRRILKLYMIVSAISVL